MALPILNDVPKYSMKIPSTGDSVKYRPYLVKEEKVLLLAMESQDPNQYVRATLDTINACVENCPKHLTTFDVEYMFIQLRCKSVGEKVELLFTCTECEESQPEFINLENVKCETDTKTEIVELNGDISIEMRFPSYENLDLNGDEQDLGFKLIQSSMQYVITEDEKIDLSDESDESVRSFLESLTSSQFAKLTQFIEKIPKIKYEDHYVCKACGHDNKIILQGMQSFF